MAAIKLKCEQCGGNIILDSSHEIGTCENCFSQFVVKQDQIVQKITQNITKHVYGIDGKDVEELLIDAYKLIDLDENKKANLKFKRAIDIDPNCCSAWFGYASTGGDRSGYLSIIPAYITAYNLSANEKQEFDTFLGMVRYIPDKALRSAFVRSFNLASGRSRDRVFQMVSGVIGCDETEIAALAIDLCPEDWRTQFAMAKIQKIRVQWCKLEGNFLLGKHLPKHAEEVLNIFVYAYRLAKNESEQAKNIVLDYIDDLSRDKSYAVFAKQLLSVISKEK